MATNTLTQARPYARALYEVAKEEKNVGVWQNTLELATLILGYAEVRDYVNNPKVTSEQATQLLLELLSSQTDNAIRNFISLLATAKKLILLPEIAHLFTSFVARDAQIEHVTVRSACELDTATKEKLLQALTQRLQKKIELNYAVDATLIGGTIISTEQWVLDGSVQAQLHQLKQTLTQ